MIAALIAKLVRSERGAALIEFALVSPIIILMLIAALQIGMMLHASSGMQHALGEAARAARVVEDPTEEQIETMVMNRLQGTYGNVTITALTAEITAGTVSSARLTLRYAYDPEFVLIDVPPFAMQATRTVYLQD